MAGVFRNLSRRDCSAISVGAAGIAGASTCFLLRLTRSGRFCLRQMTHWVTASLTPHWAARLLRLTSDPMRFLPLAVIGSSPQIEDLDACSSPMLRIVFGQGNPCSAISVGAAGLAGATARCLLRLTHSGRFCLSANDPLGHRFLRSPLQCCALEIRGSISPVRTQKKNHP